MDLTWDAIIDACGGTGEVAGALKQLASVVSGWRTRGIPAGHWAGVVALAADRGKSEITLEVLAGIAACKREMARAEPAGSPA
jgi:hypothetical protein